MCSLHQRVQTVEQSASYESCIMLAGDNHDEEAHTPTQHPKQRQASIVPEGTDSPSLHPPPMSALATERQILKAAAGHAGLAESGSVSSGSGNLVVPARFQAGGHFMQSAGILSC